MALSQIEMLNKLIKATKDETELASYQTELLAAIKTEQEATLRTEIEKKIRDEMKAGLKVQGPTVQVVETDNYKGFNLKKEKAALLGKTELSTGLRSRLSFDNGKNAEVLMKGTIDLYSNALRNPFHGSPLMRNDISPLEESGTIAAGGALVAPEFATEFLSYLSEESVALQDANIVTMVSDVQKVPVELTRTSVNKTAEGVDATESEPTFDQLEMIAHRYDSFIPVTNELLNDQIIRGGVVSILLDYLRENVNQKIDGIVFAGTGDPISSIFLSAYYSQVFGSGSTSFSDLNFDDVRGIMAKVPYFYMRNPKWYMSQGVLYNNFYGIKNQVGNPIFVPDPVTGGPGRVMGAPVRISSQMPNDDSTGQPVALYADLKQCVTIGERLSQIQLFVNPYSSAKKYLTEFYLFTRFGFLVTRRKTAGTIFTA